MFFFVCRVVSAFLVRCVFFVWSLCVCEGVRVCDLELVSEFLAT